MMKRKQYDTRFKTPVALEAIQNQRTPPAQIASEYEGNPNPVTQWKKQVLEALPERFKNRPLPSEKANEPLIAFLYRQIGELKVERDGLKKKWEASLEQKRALVEPAHPHLSVTRQCEWLGLASSAFDSEQKGESPQNLLMMRLLDEQYTRTPVYGVPRMTAWLRSRGHQ
ncbi:hypothetical protein HYR99_11900 [Candidatus Poribacteria bacterium]|nr:hypothetical protein [Candidatus Poribacteria bacterium]